MSLWHPRHHPHDRRGRERGVRHCGPHRSDPLNGKISDESPVGHALLGKAVGDKAEVLLPTGHTVEYTVLNITHAAG